MKTLSGFFIFAFFSFFTYAEGLQCYSCVNCDRVTSSELITCTPIPILPTTSTTASPADNTTLPSNTTLPVNTTSNQQNIAKEDRIFNSPEVIGMDGTTSTVYCFVYTLQGENNTSAIVRGCGDHVGTNLTVCDHNVTTIQQCRTCTTDGCNDAHIAKSSLILLLSLFSLVSLRVF